MLAKAELSCHSNVVAHPDIATHSNIGEHSNIAGAFWKAPSREKETKIGGGEKKRYKEGERQIHEGIAFTFAVIIATPILQFAFRKSHFTLYILSYYHLYRASSF